MVTHNLRQSARLILVLVFTLAVVALVLGLQATNAAQACTPRADWPIYTVVRGDTLARIAQRYNTSTAVLISANCLTDPNRIFSGQRLRVPPGGGGQPPSSRPFTVWATYQRYERGHMIWRADNGTIYAFSETDGQWGAFPPAAYARQPDNPFFNVPPGRIRPILGFGKLWGSNADVRDRLGWATAPEQGYLARIQIFSSAQNLLITIPDGRVITTNRSRWAFSNGGIPTPPPIPTPFPLPTLVPTQPPTSGQNIPATLQHFEGGFMLWRTDDSSIWVFTGRNGGQVLRFASSVYGGLPLNPQNETPPPGRLHPMMGFGKVWYNFPNVRQTLGWAFASEQSFILFEQVLFVGANLNIPGATIFVNNTTWSIAAGSLPSVPPIGPIPPIELRGAVVVSPTKTYQRDTYGVTNGQLLTLTWPEAPGNISRVEFFAERPNQPRISIGMDVNADDGVQITWLPEPNFVGSLFATAYVGISGPIAQSNPVKVWATPGDPTLTPVDPTPVVLTKTTYAAYQPYDKGLMLWRQDNQVVFALFSGGGALGYGVAVYGSLPDNPVTDPTPAGHVRPVNAFGKVWGNDVSLREVLGWPVAPEQGYTMTEIRTSGNPEASCLSLPDGRNVSLVSTLNGWVWGYKGACS
jgi:hypothetical protein